MKVDKSVCVGITTFQRPRCLERLTKRLKELNTECKIVVISDEPDYTFNDENIDLLLLNSVNLGKKGWWHTVNSLWSAALSLNCDYYIQLVDDALPNDNFFEDALRLWDSIKDPKKIAMHLANNGREQNWTRFKRVSYNDELYFTQTTEMSFFCLPEFIQYRIPRIDPAIWIRNPLFGSGVGPALNGHWIKMGRRIYGVKRSLIHKNPDADESQMNKKERKRNPWKLL